MKLLRALVIRAFSAEYDRSSLSLEKMSLPQLADLSLEGPIPDFILKSLHAPSLKRLTIIITIDMLHVPKGLEVNPEELFWELPLLTWPVPLDSEVHWKIYNLFCLFSSVKKDQGSKRSRHLYGGRYQRDFRRLFSSHRDIQSINHG
jgi:hypothetical protein